MLVLTRKTEESLLIDGGIEVRVLAIEGNRVRLGINAPREVLVLRHELRSAPAGPAPDADDICSPLQRRIAAPGLLVAARHKLAGEAV